MLKIYTLSFLLFLFYCDTAPAQTSTIEKNRLSILRATTKTEQLQAIFSLCENGNSLHSDTLMLYANKAAGIASSLNNKEGMVTAMYYQCFALTNKGMVDSSLLLANRCLTMLSSGIKDAALMANIYNQMGRCHMRKNQYNKAIDLGYKVIDKAEQAGNVLLQMKGKTLMGWAYLEMGKTKDALQWHLKALHTTNDTLLLEKYSILFANLALNYSSLGNMDSSFYYINRGIRYAEKSEDLFALSNSLAIQAQLFVRIGNVKLAEAPLKKVVEIRKLIGDPFYIVSDMSQLALYYAHNAQYEKGIAISNEGIEIAKHYRLDTKLLFLYSSLAENYKAMGNTAKYAAVLETIINLKDAVFEKNSAQALAEMQTKYELQKKENTIILQKLDLSKKDYLFYGSLLLVLFIAVIAWILFKNYKKNNQLAMQRMQEKEKILSAQAIKDAEEKERKRIAADLHDNIGAFATAISANIDDLVLKNTVADEPILKSIKENAAEIMLNLRDTIWVLHKEAVPVTSISDRFKAYSQKISGAYPGIFVEIREDIKDDILLSPEHALHVLRIMQEAFHNALRHSKCSGITVSIISYHGLRIKVMDNGSGISSEEKSGGTGLKNMQQRAAAMGWKLLIKNLGNAGAAIELHAATLK